MQKIFSYRWRICIVLLLLKGWISDLKRIKIFNRRDDAIYKTLWKNFEYGLGEANEAEILDFSKSIVDDLDLDGGPVGIKDTMDDYWEE